ncbi:MAG: biotin/lipoyl-binding protein, partial [Winogradskyella sp.]|nr:biotin/lipoyl-binding protein [Winogradskyella sp.]
MILEMKVPSPGESITEVEIAEWLVEDGDYVEKDQAIAEVDSDKATLELPAEASGTITLKAEVGDAVEVGAVVCLIDTSAEPEAGATTTYQGGDEGGGDDKVEKKLAKEQKEAKSTDAEISAPTQDTYASGTASPAAKKILSERGIDAKDVKGTGKDGRITKQDAVEATPSMGTPTGGNRGSSRSKMSMLRRKVAERLVEAKNT